MNKIEIKRCIKHYRLLRKLKLGRLKSIKVVFNNLKAKRDVSEFKPDKSLILDLNRDAEHFQTIMNAALDTFAKNNK